MFLSIRRPCTYVQGIKPCDSGAHTLQFTPKWNFRQKSTCISALPTQVAMVRWRCLILGTHGAWSVAHCTTAIFSHATLADILLAMHYCNAHTNIRSRRDNFFSCNVMQFPSITLIPSRMHTNTSTVDFLSPICWLPKHFRSKLVRNKLLYTDGKRTWYA